MSVNAASGAVELSGLTKTFPSTPVPAVAGIDLQIRSGEFVTLLGPSGSGKTTTLNMIAGFEQPTSGHVYIGGTDVSSLPPHKRGLGMVFQQYALFPHLTVAQNVAFPLRRRKVGKQETAKRVADVLELVGLHGFGDRLPAQLSGGQQQRVALARAVVFNPPVLLMDEPLGALDKKLREQLQSEIARMHRELGITFVFVTHDQEEALALSDRVVVFNEGRIDQVGTAVDLYETPASLFVAQFLGDSNVFRGVVRETGGRRTLVGAGHELTVGSAAAQPAGTAAAMVVRPERVRLEPVDAVLGSDVNALGATVAEVVYQGSYRKVNFRCDSGVTGSCREHVGDTSHASSGDRVLVTWAVDQSVVVPDPAGDANDQAAAPSQVTVPA
ncbi:MAG TPA: ABC transporter ATP-binding protein [Mycobacteriales bacterium]|jgi:putative spermidine/putrescine transport system ATP-binding protein